MLAHCAQTVEEETVPAAVAPPAARGRASDEGVKKGLAAGEQDDANYSRKEKSLGLLCDKFLQEYSSAAEVRSDLEIYNRGGETGTESVYWTDTIRVCLYLRFARVAFVWCGLYLRSEVRKCVKNTIRSDNWFMWRKLLGRDKYLCVFL